MECEKIGNNKDVLLEPPFDICYWKDVLDAHSRGQRHTRRLRILDSFTANGVDICQADHSVEDQLRLSSYLEDLNREGVLLEGLNFLRVYLGTGTSRSYSGFGFILINNRAGYL